MGRRYGRGGTGASDESGGVEGIRYASEERQNRTMRTAILARVMALLLASAAVVAGPLEDGKTAAQRGDSATALRLWMPLAEQGVAAAQFNLGFMYDNGLGVPPDYAQAMQWYRQAAEQGYADAQYSLGSMYANGRGVPRDDAQAVQWYRKAAAQGLALAQTNLGFNYSHGRGVPQDDALAVQWYRKAAEQGDAGAQYNLGSMYANGRGVPRDDAQAVQWYRKAAGQGFAGANNSIGLIYGRSSWHYVRGHIGQFILATLLLGMGLAVLVRRWLRRKVTV